MFPGCLPCSCSPALARFDSEFARASSSLHLNALPVHALRQVRNEYDNLNVLLDLRISASRPKVSLICGSGCLAGPSGQSTDLLATVHGHHLVCGPRCERLGCSSRGLGRLSHSQSGVVGPLRVSQGYTSDLLFLPIIF